MPADDASIGADIERERRTSGRDQISTVVALPHIDRLLARPGVDPPHRAVVEQAQLPVRGTDPQAALAIQQQAEDAGTVQRRLHRHRSRAAIGFPMKETAAGGAQPQPALAIVGNRTASHRGTQPALAHQPEQRRTHLEQTVMPAAGPQIALVVPGEIGHARHRQLGRFLPSAMSVLHQHATRGLRHPPAPVRRLRRIPGLRHAQRQPALRGRRIAVKLGLRADQQAVAIQPQQPHRVVVRRQRNVLKHAAFDPVQAVIATDKQRPRPIHDQLVVADRTGMLAPAHLPADRIELQQPRIGRRPDPTIPRLQHPVDLAARGADRQMPETGAVADAQSGVFRPDPQISIAAFEQRGDAIAGRSVDAPRARTRAAMEDGEGGAVETGQTAEGADPQITVAGLNDGVHMRLRQTVVAAVEADAYAVVEGRVCTDRSADCEQGADEQQHGPAADLKRPVADAGGLVRGGAAEGVNVGHVRGSGPLVRGEIAGDSVVARGMAVQAKGRSCS
ncbi:hypothetical protein FHW84_004529 [Dyella sp. SG562]|uniref:hypothetical protein n=1 Tax=Dyella sp. SG562 TaxID=2587017 RepID=UPI001FBB90D1|nr:hypothetical protein [Dyella sp. SG562]NII75918.1 hypothetical protein [Dyella sp. SG562]